MGDFHWYSHYETNAASYTQVWANWKITFATVASKKEDANILQESYTAKDLAVLEGLDAVRKRPGMYIGSTDSRGLMHCLWEIIDNEDNTVDEEDRPMINLTAFLNDFGN